MPPVFAAEATYDLSSLTSVDNGSTLITEYKLNQNYPNPFNPSTVISYQLPTDGLVTIKVYNLLGSEVTTLINKTQNAGTHNVTFNATNLSSGIYFYEIKSGSFSDVKKLMLLR